jgi:hypothetical protein
MIKGSWTVKEKRDGKISGLCRNLKMAFVIDMKEIFCQMEYEIEP